MNSRPFFVWKRSDGYVGCTVGAPRNGRDTFEILLETWEWPQAFDAIVENRDSDEFRALVASWNQEAA